MGSTDDPEAGQANDGERHGGLWRLGQMLFLASKDFFHDHGPQWAAAIAYYSLLSAFPLLLLLSAIAAYFVDPQTAIDQVTQLVGELLPQGSGQVQSVVKGALQARGTVAALSLPGLLWTGSRVFSAVTTGLNIAYDVDETYGFLKRTLLQLAMMASVGLAFVLAFLANPATRLVWNGLNLPAQGLAFRATRQVLPIALLLLAFYLAYQLVPRKRIGWRPALLGAGLATLMFLGARPLFTYYVSRFAQYNLIYGSLAIAVIIVFWAWIVGLILLLGGEIASHAQTMLVEGRPAAEVEAGHLLRSPVRKVLPDEMIPGEDSSSDSDEQ
jgi:membrane protein